MQTIIYSPAAASGGANGTTQAQGKEGVQSVPSANGAAQSAAVAPANGAVAPQPEIEIAPTATYKVGGRVIQGADLEKSIISHEQRLSQANDLNNRSRLLEKQATEFQAKLTVADKVLSSDILAHLTRSIIAGKNEAQALAELGYTSSAAVPSIKPFTGDRDNPEEITRYLDTEVTPKISGMTVNPEIVDIKRQVATLTTQMEADKRQQAERATIQSENWQLMSRWPEYLEANFGIDYSTLTPEQKQSMDDRIVQGFNRRGINVNVPDTFNQRKFDEQLVSDVVYREFAKDVYAPSADNLSYPRTQAQQPPPITGQNPKQSTPTGGNSNRPSAGQGGWAHFNM